MKIVYQFYKKGYHSNLRISNRKMDLLVINLLRLDFLFNKFRSLLAVSHQQDLNLSLTSRLTYKQCDRISGNYYLSY